jgi:hypothetical protein
MGYKVHQLRTSFLNMKNVQMCEGVEGTWRYHLCPLDDDTGTKSLCGARTMSSPALLSHWGFKPKHMPAHYCKECELIANRP